MRSSKHFTFNYMQRAINPTIIPSVLLNLIKPRSNYEINLILYTSLGLASSFAQAQNQNPYFPDPYFGNNGVQISNNPPGSINTDLIM